MVGAIFLLMFPLGILLKVFTVATTQLILAADLGALSLPSKIAGLTGITVI